MIKYSLVITIFSLFITMYPMDENKNTDTSIRKIIDGTNIIAIAFLNNKEIIMQKLQPEEFIGLTNLTELIDLSTDQVTDFCTLTGIEYFYKNSIETDYRKAKALLFGSTAEGHKAIIYDSEIKQVYISPISYFERNWVNTFGYSPDTILVNNHNREILSHNYIIHSTEVEQTISAFLENNQHLSAVYCPTKKILCCSKNLESGGIYLYDFTGSESVRCLTGKKASDMYYSPNASFIVFQHGRNCNLWCPYKEYEGQPHYSCDCSNKCSILDLTTQECIALANDQKHSCSVTIHPNNTFVVTQSGYDNIIQYWDAKTGKCIAQHQSPTPLQDKFLPFPLDRALKTKRLSFSADGTLLAALFPTKCIIFHVPFEIIYGVGTKEKLVRVLLMLGGYYHNGELLPKDVVRLLVRKTMHVSRL